MSKMRPLIWAAAFAAVTAFGPATGLAQEYGETPEAPTGKFSDAEKTIDDSNADAGSKSRHSAGTQLVAD